MSDTKIQGRNMIRYLLWYWLPPLIWMGCIFFFSAQPDLPGPPQPWLNTLFTNLGHFIAYGFLALWWYRALSSVPSLYEAGELRTRVARMTFLIALLYAASDEFHQSFVPGRDASLLDLMVDSGGVAVALLLISRRK